MASARNSPGPSATCTLTSVTDFKDFDKFQAITADGGPASTVNALFDAEATTWTQELRLNGELDRMRWVAGAYYLNVNLDSNFSLPAEPNSLFEPLVGVPWEDVALTKLRTDSTSLFGQVEYDLTDSLTLIGGAARDPREQGLHGRGNLLPQHRRRSRSTRHTELFNVQPRTNHDVSDTLWSGKLQLDWQADPTTCWCTVASIAASRRVVSTRRRRSAPGFPPRTSRTVKKC